MIAPAGMVTADGLRSLLSTASVSLLRWKYWTFRIRFISRQVSLVAIADKSRYIFVLSNLPYTHPVAKSKDVTREEAELMKAKAGDFMERIGQSGRAAEFDYMSVDEYAEHKGLRLKNPSHKTKRRLTMAAPGYSKTDLEDQIDRAIEVLDDADDVGSSREDLANALSGALDILRGDDDDDDATSDEDEDED